MPVGDSEVVKGGTQVGYTGHSSAVLVVEFARQEVHDVGCIDHSSALEAMAVVAAVADSREAGLGEQTCNR